MGSEPASECGVALALPESRSKITIIRTLTRGQVLGRWIVGGLAERKPFAATHARVPMICGGGRDGIMGMRDEKNAPCNLCVIWNDKRKSKFSSTYVHCGRRQLPSGCPSILVVLRSCCNL